MNIDKFKAQHIAILDGIARLREATQGGIVENAASIAAHVVKLSGTVKLHLRVEDSVLYPGLASDVNPRLARLGERYQREMDGIASAYFEFATRWNLANRVEANPEGFRADANRVLRVLFERMKREDTEFYPAIEAAHPPA
ncbi:hemerythrin domain-containing protein [Massilia sp. GER05]|uniref:hemerythrin domain-containing protein n=1 Tax=unclassified Massilia TaxID=2609279 RepID=UPI0039AF21EF